MGRIVAVLRGISSALERMYIGILNGITTILTKIVRGGVTVLQSIWQGLKNFFAAKDAGPLTVAHKLAASIIRPPVIFSAIWVFLTFYGAVSGDHDLSNICLVVGFVLPFIVLYVFPLIAPGVGALAADKDTHTKVEGFTEPLMVSWIIGLMFAVVARLGDWRDQGLEFLLHLMAYAIAAGLHSAGFHHARWTRTANWCALMIALVTTLLGFNKHQVSYITGRIGTNWVPSADNVRDTGKSAIDYVKALKQGETKTKLERDQQTVDEKIAELTALKDTVEKARMGTEAARTIPLGYIPPDPPKVKKLNAGWVPPGLVPTFYSTSEGGFFPVNKFTVTDVAISLTCYSPTRQQNVTLSWARESFEAHLEYERDGDWATYPIRWDPTLRRAVGSRVIDGRVFTIFVDFKEP